MAELWIGRQKSPITYFKICKMKLEEKGINSITLIGLEGAIIHAVDTANLLVRNNLMEISNIHTDYIEVELELPTFTKTDLIGKKSNSW